MKKSEFVKIAKRKIKECENKIFDNPHGDNAKSMLIMLYLGGLVDGMEMNEDVPKEFTDVLFDTSVKIESESLGGFFNRDKIYKE